MNALAAQHKAITADTVSARLNPKGFHTKTPINQLSDPIADTPMVVTLDQLRPYDNNPRTTRNPAYEEIKESIRARGLDNPPQITKRPGDEFYIIRNGGNTRLEILNELYRETRDEKFNRINCLFRPWQSETSMLVGHLAENEVRGNLSFIEKAVGIKRLKDMYEAEGDGKQLSLRKLSERLKEDGFPVSFSLLGKMLDCVDSLLPAIPQTLYAGLGSPPVVKLLSLRNGLSKVFKDHGNGNDEEFRDFWVSILSGFDIRPEEFKFNRIEDEMIGRMSERIGRDFNMITYDLYEIDPNRYEDQGGVGFTAPTFTPPAGLPLTGAQSTSPVHITTLTAPATRKQSPKKPPVATKEATTVIGIDGVDGANGEQDEGEIVARLAQMPRNNKAQHGPVILPNQQDYPGASKDVVMVGLHTPSTDSDIEDDWIIDGAGGGQSLLAMRMQCWGAAFHIASWGGNSKMAHRTDKEGIGFLFNPNEAKKIKETAKSEEDVKRASTAMFIPASLTRSFGDAEPEVKARFHGCLWSQALLGGYDITIDDQEAQKTDYLSLPDDVLFHLFRLIRLARQVVALEKAGLGTFE